MNGKEEVVYKPTTVSNTEAGLLKPDKQNEEEGTSGFLYVAAFTVNLMAFACGTIFAWTSPVFPKLNGQVDPELNPLPKPITTFEESLIGSIPPGAAAIGCLVAGKLSDKLGRKKTILISTIPILSSLVMVALASNVNLIYLGRFLGGIGVGFVFSVVPIYVGEIAESKNRGALGCAFGLFISFGVLYVYAVGPFLTVQAFSLTLIVPVILFLVIFTVYIPESPVYLTSTGDTDGALRSLCKLRNKTDKAIKVELADIVRLAEETKSNSGGIRDIFRSKGLTKGLITTILLVLFQQGCGIGIVLSFLESIFASTGASISPKIAAIIIGAIQSLTNIATYSVVEKFGRRTLLLISTAGSAISIFFLGLYSYLQYHQYNVDFLFWLPIASLFFYIIFFNIGIGPLPWAVLGEMFPANVKSIAATITSFTCFFVGFLILEIFPYLKGLIGASGTFWTFSVSAGSAFVFIYFYLIETKGKTLDEIQRCLSGEDKRENIKFKA